MDSQIIKADVDAKAMPPPPAPKHAALEQEIEGLRRCLQNAIVKMGQVYGFYADIRRLGITKHVNQPPKSLTSSVGRELEKYDQLCDTLEGQLLRAIAVLQRDLRKEEKKQAIALLEAQKQAAEAIADKPADNLQFVVPTPPPNTAESLPTTARNSPTHPGIVITRRPSAISISSLHRPSIPLKLDLSSSALRLTSEEASSMYGSGLASPVTLAPKSARPMGPNEYPDEFMAAFNPPPDTGPVIDLTVGENEHKIKNAGDSSDKPIELDLDGIDMDISMNDIFGDHSETTGSSNLPQGVENIFTMSAGASSSMSGSNADKADKDNYIDLDAQDIFASLSNNSISSSSNNAHSASAPAGAPSPSTLLAAGFSQHLSTNNSSEGQSGSDQQFDITSLGDLGDLDVFNSTSDFSITDMDAFLGMGSGAGSTAIGGNVVDKPAGSGS